MIGEPISVMRERRKVYEASLCHIEPDMRMKPCWSGVTDPIALENEKVSGAIKTDFILSAEIMAITLASIPDGNIWIGTCVGVVGMETQPSYMGRRLHRES